MKIGCGPYSKDHPRFSACTTISSFYGTIQGSTEGASKRYHSTIFEVVIPRLQFEPWSLAWIFRNFHLIFAEQNQAHLCPKVMSGSTPALILRRKLDAANVLL